MGLRNAFEEIGLESTLRQILRAVSFSRDSADRLRVIVDSSPMVYTYMNNSSTNMNGGASPTPNTAGTWNVVDAREEFREQSLQSFQNTRNRWTIT